MTDMNDNSDHKTGLVGAVILVLALVFMVLAIALPSSLPSKGEVSATSVVEFDGDLDAP